MQQLFITIVAMLSVIVPIAAFKLRRLLITPRLLQRFHVVFASAAAQIDLPGRAVQVSGAQLLRVLGTLQAWRRGCDDFLCRLFPKQFDGARLAGVC